MVLSGIDSVFYGKFAGNPEFSEKFCGKHSGDPAPYRAMRDSAYKSYGSYKAYSVRGKLL